MQHGSHLPQGDIVKIKLLFAVATALSLSAFAQTNSQTTMAVEPMSPTPIFRVTVVSRRVQAVNYKHRGGATKLDFAGTDLMPLASGQAKVESKKGYIEIEVEFGNLQKPTTFGNEYLTYILCAISPEGRAVNLGEVLVGGNSRSKLDVTTDLQAFALVVTAEPYYAVRQPSNVVVLENVVRKDTKGTTEAVNTKYELLERGGYIPTGYKFDPVVLNAKLPLEFFEARNALRIAQSEGAEQHASDSYQHAVQLMNKVDEYATSKHSDRKAMIAVAREAVQTAEHARAITVQKIEKEHLDNERQAAANAQIQTQAQADDAISRASIRPSLNTGPFSKKCAPTPLVLPNCDFDSGKPTKAAEYSLTDDTYAKLLGQLPERKFDLASPELRDDILNFYSDLSVPIEKKGPGSLARRVDCAG
jgi:hypothetical protein